ncbi:MAG: hypothetical protein ACREOL_04375 [Candidatus Dormibacteria bacterium]
MSLKGVRVAVVFGSRSVEHEISIITACQAMPVLKELGAEVVPVYITKGGGWITAPQLAELGSFRERLPEEGQGVLLDLARGRLLSQGGSLLGRPSDLAVDVILPLLHGSLGEDGCLQGLARLARIPLVGTGVAGSALAMDKFRSKQLFLQAGLPVVPGRLAADPARARELGQELGFPLVVKPNRGGSSVGVALAHDVSELESALTTAFNFDSELVLEPVVPDASDLNCAVKCNAPRQSLVERHLRSQELLSYEDKYARRGKLVEPLGKSAGDVGGPKSAAQDPSRELPARISDVTRERVQGLALAAFDLLGCRGTARVDFLLSDRGDLFLNEVNTIPGSLAAHLWSASSVPFPALLEELVREALQAAPERTLVLPQNLLQAGELLGKAGP